MKKIYILLFTSMILLSMNNMTYANATDATDDTDDTSCIQSDALDSDDIDSYGDFLVKMNILQGNNAGDLMLDKELTREEFVSIILRMYEAGLIENSGNNDINENIENTENSEDTEYTENMGNMGNIENEKNNENNKSEFTDISKDHWAYGDIIKAYNLGLVAGIGNEKFGIDKVVDQQQAMAFIMKYLNYDLGWNDIIEKSDELIGLHLDEDTKEFKRAHVFELLAKAIILPNSAGESYIENKYKSEGEIFTDEEYEKIKILINEKLTGSTERILRGSLGQIEYYIHSLRPEYLTYKSLHKDYADEKIILDINMKMNKIACVDIDEALDAGELTVLCNKHYKFDEEFQPECLIELDSKYHISDRKKYFLDERIVDPYKSMYEDAKTEGLNLLIASAYRSYNYQKGLFNTYKNRYGEEKADTFSARAGHSEHQTGLAFDLYPVKEKFEDTAAFKWLTDNASKYGFILRYPKGKEEITGYMYEPWHYRYVGKDIAEKIKKEDISYDEYYAKYILPLNMR